MPPLAMSWKCRGLHLGAPKPPIVRRKYMPADVPTGVREGGTEMAITSTSLTRMTSVVHATLGTV